MVMVSICKSIDIETDVSVDVDEITCALHERLQSVEERYKNEDQLDTGRIREILGFVNSTWQCLQAVTEKMIASTKPEQRKIIFDALTVQANRWSEASATLSESKGE